MQKSRYIAQPETHPASPKVNRAYAQSRPSGILIAQAIGKLCLGATEMLSSHQNNLPPLLQAGGKRAPKSAFF